MKKIMGSLFHLIFLRILTSSALLLLAACGGSSSVGNEVSPGNMVNQKPTANAGNDLNTSVGSSVVLDGSNSSDPENSPLRYRWNISRKPPSSTVVLLNGTSANPSFVADVTGFYVVQLVVNDGAADSAVNEVVITVSKATNLPPIANAGISTTVTVGTSVNLDGSNSSDPEGKSLTYRWAFSSKPVNSNAVLLDVTNATPSFMADMAGEYIIQVTVNDGVADSQPSVVVITATEKNIRPIANAGSEQIVAANATIFLDGSASVDPNGDALRYFWSVIDPNGVRERNISYAATANYIPAALGDYIFELKVRDDGLGGYKDIDEVRITVATRAVNLSWPANTDSPAGYAVYAGPDTGSANKLVRILKKGSASWDPINPGVRLGWETILRAAGLALDATNVCLTVRAYNGFGLSDPSVSSCYTK